ncbi:cell wall metabolism sensor histidine kinase WalK [Marinicrinis lubricantis]|uniref:histidine kinase n=1 Tax=Marinicrinis lubricantis TaxID=2086470 RepID=A0ABW1IRI9_9BACL
MKRLRFYQSIQIKLIIIYVLLILIAMQLIGVYFVRTMENSFRNNFSEDLNSKASLLAEYVRPYLSTRPENKDEDGPAAGESSLSDVVNNFNQIIGAEIQVIDMNGMILSSTMYGGDIGQKNTDPLISRALQGIKNQEREVIDAFNVRKSALALPVKEGSKTIGAVYILASMEELLGTIDSINQIFLAGTIIALALTAILGIILSNTITAPIKVITRRATAMAEGDFNQKVQVIGNDEIGQLGHAFNYMTQRLKEALSSIEEEKDKLASILSNMRDGVVAADEAGRIILMNRRALQMLQTSELQVSGKDVGEVLKLPEGSSDLSEGYTAHTALMDIVRDELPEPLKVRLTFTPIKRRHGGIAGTIIVLQDVTEQEKLEQSRREFVANVSHELRTPLTTIKSYLEALDEGAMHDPELASKFIGVTRNETERMIRLVSDLLHLSRFDSKQAILHREPTDIREMLEVVSDRFSFQLLQKHITIELDTASDLPLGDLDSDAIDQVLDNLVSNAIKYTPDGGSIRLSARLKEDHWIEVQIADTGQGIPKKDLERIFERFYRVDKARSRNMGGTGLGLSIAREIVRAHGGNIRIDSEMNKGTTVTFTLPAEEKEVSSIA